MSAGGGSHSILSLLTTLAALALAAITINSCGSSRRHGRNADVSSSDESLACHCDSTRQGPHEFLEWDEMAQLVKMKTPKYPKEARKHGIRGAVWIEVLVLPDGTATNPCVWKSSGHLILDRAAWETATKNKFKPAMKDGKPIAMWVTWRVVFD